MEQHKQQNPCDVLPPHIEAMLKDNPALSEAAQYGVDVAMLLDNLKLSVSERLNRHQAAIDAIRFLQKKTSVISGLLELLVRLTKSDVPFVLVGDFAAAAYTKITVSHPMEICCDFTAENILRLQNALADFHPVHRMTPDRKPMELTQQNVVGLKNLYLDTDLGVLDCLGYVNGIGEFEQVLKASRKIETDGLILNILMIDALIKAMEAMQRPLDKQTVIELKAIREQSKNGN